VARFPSIPAAVIAGALGVFTYFYVECLCRRTGQPFLTSRGRVGPIAAGIATFVAGYSEFLDQFIGSVVLLVVLQIALAIVAAIATGASQAQQLMRDERERTIELEASRIALPVVQLGAVMAAGAIALGAPPTVTAHGLVLMLVLGEVVRLGGQILYFHRGV
jgi:uncharacterized membrane protein